MMVVMMLLMMAVVFCRYQQPGWRLHPADGSGWFLLTFSQSE